MKGRGRKGKLQAARDEAAERAERMSELERAHLRLEHLYQISKLLAGFHSVERTVPDVIAVIAQTISLHSAVLVEETAATPRMIAWQARGAPEQRLLAAKAHAQRAYRYLVGSGVDLEREDPQDRFIVPIVLPLVIDHGSIFGVFQIDAAEELSELDLMFVNAVVNQLAIALHRDAAQRALSASEAKLSGIVSISADAIISVDEAQRIIMYNEGAGNIFGWSRDEVLGQPLDILLPERFREVHRQHLRNFAAEPATARQMGERHPAIFGLRKSGEEFPAQAAISKLRIGDAWLFTVNLRDITEHKRIEREEKFLADVGSVLASTLDYEETPSNLAKLVVADLADACIVETVEEEEPARRLKVTHRDPGKASVAEALQRGPVEGWHLHLGSSVLETKQPLLMNEVSPEYLDSIAQSDEHRRALRQLGPTSFMALPLLAHGRLVGVLVLASTKEGHRFGAEDLRVAEEVARRAALALENARLYRIAQRAIQARDDVLGVVAHDLRNPLGTILMHASLLRRHGSEPERRSRRPAEAIERAVTRMTRLIEDLLEVSRMEAGSLAVQQARVSAWDIVGDSVEAQKALVSSASLELRLEVARDLPEVWADRDRLLQVFENLVGNAVKFTGPGGRITVGAAPHEGEVLFWVNDTGSGIAAEDLPQVFDRFWQASKVGRRGAGLGLPISKGIVEAHGGRIWVDSTPGGGSTFFFTIPTALRVEERPHAPPASHSP
jgi:PAS domain S-box-containing protein